MAANQKTVYIKAERNTEVARPVVTLGDVLEIACVDPAVCAKIKTIRLCTLHTDRKEKQSRMAVSILKVIELICGQYPNIEVQNMGETDFIITYEEKKTAGRWAHVLKASLVVLISFAGAAFSIMAFNNDIDVTKIFAQIYELVTGRKSDGFTMLELTYSIGLVIGILVFFNHFGTRRFSVDPTPIEVEMRLYENDLQTTLIENISRKEKELDVDTGNRAGDHRT